MQETFEDKLFDECNTNGLFDGVERVLLAVSGGADSVVMAHALRRLQQDGRLGCGVVIGHVNHGLRGADSDGDEAFVVDLGRRLGVETVTVSVGVRDYAAKRKLSIETAGRVLRLEALAAMARDKHCGAVATAHHADDQAETVVHRMMRGTGFRGLCGIRPVSVMEGMRFVRPMLGLRRGAILGYAAANRIDWREDASNAAFEFTRNRIRHRLLPALGAADLTEKLVRLAAAAQRLQQRVDAAAGEAVEEVEIREDRLACVVFDRAKLAACPPWVFYEMLRQSLVRLGAGLRRFTQGHFQAVREMLEQTKAKADFPGGIEVVVEGDSVFIRHQHTVAVGGDHPPYVCLRIGGAVRFGRWRVSARIVAREGADFEGFLKGKGRFVEWFDADRVAGEVVIRQRRAGDRFWPMGARNAKKVGRFLIDAGLNARTKETAFVVEDARQILWVAPVRPAEAVKVTTQTRRILEIRVEAVEPRMNTNRH